LENLLVIITPSGGHHTKAPAIVGVALRSEHPKHQL